MASLWRIRLFILIVFVVLAGLSALGALRLQFAFSLDQFFPKGDPDLAFYQDFIAEFDSDVNFLLVALVREDGVFEQDFLEQAHDFSLSARRLPTIRESRSLTQLSYPLKTPFGITTVPVIHIDQPSRYASDGARIMQDPRFVNQFISADATSLAVLLRSDSLPSLEQSEKMVIGIDSLIEAFGFESYHLLGPPYFQKEMVAMQKREVAVSAIISGILVTLVMFLLFRKPWGIVTAMVSIGLGLLLFLGLLGGTGRPLNAMAALYPVLMIIVGTSDVIHIMSKYIDELRKGKARVEALRITIREIGLATLLTSLTTAVGFGTLLTSRVEPIQEFGFNAAVGVMVAYLTVITFTAALLSWFREPQLIRLGRGIQFWETWMLRTYLLTRDHPRKITVGAILLLLISAVGISRITTNYRVESNLPRGKKITEDFLFFENEYAGFRPMEIAVFAGDGYRADDLEVLRQIDSLERFLHTIPVVQNITSLTAVYKTINQMYGQNRPEAYQMPEEEGAYQRYRRLVDRMPDERSAVFMSTDGTKTRISSRLLDVGADSIKAIGTKIDEWIAGNTNPSVVTFKRTGTGLILDKNSEYVRDSLLQGLGLAVLIVSLLMALLFRNLNMVIISMIPNALPLLLAGAMLGFLGIELEAGISIVFAVVFGIAVDDTIHFLSKYKLAREKGLDMEEALRITFLETGKAICLTTVILFFGFLVMLFSIHPPSVTVGALISLTLFSALFSDLLLIPLLIRALLPKH